MRIRVNTASATARRRVIQVKIPDAKSGLKRPDQKRLKSAPIKKREIRIPLQDQNLKIEPKTPCHKLLIYKKRGKSVSTLDNIEKLQSLQKENDHLKERLKNLESGIKVVSNVLSNEHEEPKPKRKAKRKPRTKQEPSLPDLTKSSPSDLSKFLSLMESSLLNFTKVLDKMEKKSKN